MADSPISQAEYARHRGVSREAVRKAIRDGRLKAAVVKVKGRAKIRDAKAADDEWITTTTPSRSRAAGPQPPERDGPDPLLDLTSARHRLEVARGSRAEVGLEMDRLDLAVRRGELIEVEQAQADVMAFVVAVRQRMLAIASRLGQRHPEAVAVAATVADLVYEALADLAALAEDEKR